MKNMNKYEIFIKQKYFYQNMILTAKLLIKPEDCQELKFSKAR